MTDEALRFKVFDKMEKENSQIFTQSQEDDTESLLRRARNLINGYLNLTLVEQIFFINYFKYNFHISEEAIENF